MCKQTWSSKSHDISQKSRYYHFKELPSTIHTSSSIYTSSANLLLKNMSSLNILIFILDPWLHSVFYVHGSMLPARELPCSLLNAWCFYIYKILFCLISFNFMRKKVNFRSKLKIILIVHKPSRFLS